MADPCICPVVQNCAGNVISNLSGVIFTAISNPVTLVLKCNNNVDNLKQQVDKLKLKKKTVEENVDVYCRTGVEIGQELKNWLTKANNFIEAADKLVADSEENAKKKCFFGLCLNPKSRYQLSKKAEENSKAVAELVDEACGFNLAPFHIPAPQQEVAAPVKGFEDFNSRGDFLEKIMGALQSQSSKIIGVYGMPGVGKTMLVKEVKRRAEQDKLFDGVAMALVSRNADLKDIQVDIARGLGLDQLPIGITTQDAAERIKARLKKMEKVLIILDDIWGPGIDLEELGIPLRNEPKPIEGSSSREEYAECKILLTSRDSNVLTDQMGSQLNFPLVQLKDEEAWELLKRIVGDRAESDDIHSAAIEIVRECGGLPLAITTIAKALKNKKPYEWMDAVRKLKRPSSENFAGIAANVYSAIEFSYSHLDSGELKKTFLLCCLMGHKCLIQDLLKYGVGLGLFASMIEEARNEVFTLLSKLRASSLLIDDDDDNGFDMHDLIHDVAVSIACRDRLGLLLTADHEPKEWSDMDAMKDFKWIRMRYANIEGLPEELESPHLSYFYLSNKDPSLQIPPNFFRGMQRLKVLDLTHMHMSSLPSSISLLKNLHTLCLDQSVLGDIRIIGQLKNLEVLSLLLSDFKELPREIGQLTRLKLLDLSGCTKLKIIPPGVLANMSRLEELYLRSFDGWEVEENENQRNVSVSELKHLKKLTSLEVCISHIQMISNDLFFENLKRYKIFIGDKWGDRDSSIGGSRILKLHLNASISYNRLVEWLLKTAEKLHLRKLTGVKNVVAELNIEGFRDLKDLYVCDAPEILHIIKPIEGFLANAFPRLEVLFLQNLINLEKIFQGQLKETTFNKLRVITVESCDKLKNLFSSFIARQLLQLQEISVTYCSNMEEIVDDEEQGSRNDIVEATELKFGEVLRSLRLKHLPKFRRVNGSYRSMQLFNEQVKFPNLEELHLSWINANAVWHTFIATPYVEKLTKLIIEGCDNLEYLFSSSMARGMVTLGHLEIKQCQKMREVLFMENVEDNGNLIFPQLRFLVIEKLPKLRKFCSGDYVKFPCLSQLSINNCPVLKTFISGSTFGNMTAPSEKATNTCTPPLFGTKVTFPKLEQLIIQFMGSLDKIWDIQLDATSFCQLNYVNVNSCKRLLNIFPFSMLERLQRLDKLEIWNCDSLEEIFESQELEAGQSQVQKSTPPTSMESVTKFVFTKLTHLDLYTLPKLKAFCHEMHSIEWPSLKKLKVCGCDQVWIFDSELPSFRRTNGDDQLEIHIKFSLFWTSKASFPNLEELILGWSGNMKEIWHGQYIVGNYFSKLKVLKLIQFPKQSVVQPFLFQSPNLESLVVSKAPFHEIFKFEGLGGVEKPALALTQLSGLRLSELHKSTCLWEEESNLESIFYNLKTLEVLQCSKLKNLVPSFISFKNLTTLKVTACHELLNLVGYSTAKSMVQLTRLSISECDMLEEIVACLDDEVKDGIVFNQLKRFQLRGLPRLASFCSGNCSFKFASLEDVVVMGCPNMHIFSKGECNTPNKLQKVKLTVDEDEWFWEGNLNSTIQKMFREKAGYCGLEALKLFEFPELIEIWYKKPQEKLPFKRLKFLEVCNCSNLRYLLTPSMALGLVQLHDLKVINCAMMEQVIIGEVVEEMFPLLRSILLVSCSNLTCFYEGSSRLKFPSLKQISVVDCPILLAFTSSFSKDQEKGMMTADDRGSEERPNIHTQPFFKEKVVLPNLEELQLCWMNVNIKWHTSTTTLCVQKLKKLIIQGCDNLEYLFSSSIARGLVMLGRLEIRECKRMRVIIITENVEEKDNLIFPQLNFLLIKDLQNIVGFYSGNCIVEFPPLKNLQVLNCPELEGFTIKHSETTNCIADIQTLFNDQVAFPNLEWLTITHLKNFEIIWHSKLYGDSFCRLKSLGVRNCEKLSNVFPFGDIQGRIWKSLEKLIIVQCATLEGIFEIGELNPKQTHAVINAKLSELFIYDLPRLKHVWNKDPQEILTFHNLESVEVSYCGSLKNLFPTSIGKSLLQLQKLHLFQCGMEEIVTMGGEQGAEAIVNFEFHRVSSLQLKMLPRLLYFYPGKHTTVWPMLKKFYFSHFNQVKRTNGCGQLDFPVRLPLFSIEKVIPQLEELSLPRHDVAMASEHQFKQDLFFNIKVLQIQEYLDDESDALPIKFLQSFCNLEKLVVTFCNFKELFPLKGEVEEQEKHIEIETLSRIKTLNLGHLPCLKHIWGHDSLSVLQNLESLQVARCESLISLSMSAASLRSLITLDIMGCQAMINLVSVSIAQSLVQLERMIVSRCHMLTEIVGNEEDGTQDLITFTFTKLRFLTLEHLPRLESFCSGNFTFKFPSLEKVIVNQCPKLKIFNEGDLNTPLLQRVELIEGENKWHWAGDLNTTIKRTHMEKVGYTGLQFLTLSNFPELLEIWHVRNPQNILDFRQVKTLEICDCYNFRYLLTATMALDLVQLMQLIVKNCRTMEQVIMGEGAENQMEFPHLWLINLESCSNLTSFYVGSHSLELLGLNNFIVKDCPKMVTFAASTSSEDHNKEESQYLFHSKVETPNLEFLSLSSNNIHQILVNSIPELSSYVKNLQKLCVEGCGNLKYLLTCSMVKSFEQLNWLEIRDCKMMEEVILAEESVYDERMCKIFFPNLEFLLLQDLPKLTKFCSGNYLELPCLWKLKISKCPMLKTFISGFTCGDTTADFENAKNTYAKNTYALRLFDAKVAFPKLERLVIEYVESLNKIWNDQLTADSFSQLTLMSVVSCEKVLNIFPFSMLERLKKLDKLQIRNCDSLEEIFESQELGVRQLQAQKATPLPLAETVTKFAFPKLTHLDLYGLPKLKGFFLQMHITEWPSLKKLWIYGCDQVQIFASELTSFQRIRDDDQLEIQIKHPFFWLSKATFPCLEELILEKNNILKEIWNGQHPGDYLPKLKVVKLLCLREQSALPSFFFQSLPNLDRLVVSEASFDEIFHCESLSSEERPVDTPTQLSELKLSKLNELRHLWREESNLLPIFYNLRTLEVLECSKLMSLVPSIVSFENLQSLEVSKSHGLINLVRYSTAKSLAHLTRMNITDCDLIEEIVACWEDDVKDGIVFSKLKYLQLCGLPRLSSFCSVKCKFEFPFLEEVILMDCPSMQIFSMDEITAPKLQKVKRTVDEDEGVWDGNLNLTIQLQFMQKSGGDFEN